VSVFTCTFVDQSFPKRSSEVAYIVGLLNMAAASLQSQQGDAASGNIVGMSPAGVPNSILGAWVYQASGNLP